MTEATADTNTIAMRKRRAYELLRAGSDTSPVQAWTQGAARIAQGLMGGYELGMAGKEERDAKMAKAGYLASLFPQGNVSVAAPQTPSIPGALSAPTNGKVYSPDESSPLDPPSGQDRDLAIRTILAEAAHEGPVGQQAVGNVIRNRAVAGNQGGDTPTGVVTKPYQFEPWNTQGGRAKMASYDPNSPQYQNAGAALERAYTGDDPTGGAVNFFSPKAQAKLGREVPVWGRHGGQDIGGHRFFGGVNDPAVIPQGAREASHVPGAGIPQQVAQAPQPSQSDYITSRILEGLRSKDPNIAEAAASFAGQMLPHLMKPNHPSLANVKVDGEDVPVWANPKDKSVTPVELPGSGRDPNSVIPPAPPGVDKKIWKQEHSKRTTEEGMPADTKVTSALRNEVQGLPSYKNLAQAAPVYKSMLEAAGRDNRAADVNLIYGMAKIMDPGSVVRESEMTIAQAVATLPQQLRQTIESQFTSTGRLSPEVRAAIMQEAHGRIGSYQSMFDQDAGMYRGIAQRGRMNEEDVLPKFGPFQQFTAPAAKTTAAPAAAPKGVDPKVWSVMTPEERALWK